MCINKLRSSYSAGPKTPPGGTWNQVLQTTDGNPFFYWNLPLVSVLKPKIVISINKLRSRYSAGPMTPPGGTWNQVLQTTDGNLFFWFWIFYCQTPNPGEDWCLPILSVVTTTITRTTLTQKKGLPWGY